MNRLSQLAISGARTKTPGMYPDGGGLYLCVGSENARSWIFRFARDGRTRYMGLGSLAAVSLAEARRLLAGGQDPIAARDAQQAAQRAQAATAMTFRQCAESYIATHRDGWRSAKHTSQWSATLEAYVYPVLGDVPVAAVDVGLVLKVLEPIWKTRTETASRVRGRIEVVLSWAKTREYRSGENPAAWRGHLENLLPSRRKLRQVRHLSALPYPAIGSFMAELRAVQGVAARALELTVLCATRTSETLGARWHEIDLATKTWTIAAERMKGGKEHRVPLAPAALAILQAMSAIRVGDYIFPGVRAGRPINSGALLNVLERMDRKDITAHGFDVPRLVR
ncbi:MAG TPA: integrase arm-type DNA-binding domain-containing protein [Dongiaceae bacterium]|nr:integrase arm-type DNA-binding domain-containing protein [Dongiaceae bacterium]